MRIGKISIILKFDKLMVKMIHSILLMFLFISGSNCSKDSIQLNDPMTADYPEYSIVFDHGNAELCYYPRVSSNGRYLAVEREEIVFPP